MDATTLGAVLAFAGVLAGAVVAYLGKRGENALTGYTSLTSDLRAELARKKEDLAEARLQLADTERENARLRQTINDLGGTP